MKFTETIHCNCCGTNVRNIAASLLGLVKEGQIGLLYKTTRNAFVCEKCVTAHMLLVCYNGQPVMVYNIDERKFQASKELIDTYDKDFVYNPVGFEESENHLRYDLQSQTEDVNMVDKHIATIQQEEPVMERSGGSDVLKSIFD